MKQKLHYAWIICACCVVMTACGTGLAVNGFSLFLPYLARAHGFDALALGLLPTVVGVASVFAALTAGQLLQALGLRKGLYMAGLLLGFGFVLMGVSSGLLGCAAGALLLGLGATYGGAAPTSALLSAWFRGQALARAVRLCVWGGALGSLFFVPLFTALAEMKSVSWSLCAAAVQLLILSILLLLLLRQTPEELGFEPLGTEEEPSGTPHAGRMRSGGALSALALCLGAAGLPAVYFLALRAGELGQEGMAAAVVIGVFALGVPLGQELGRRLQRRGGARLSGGTLPLLFAAGAGLLAFPPAGAGAWCVCGGALLLGLGFAALGGSLSGWTAELAAPDRAPALFRRIQPAYLTGTLLGLPLSGVLAQLRGDWRGGYALCAGLALLSVTLAQLLYLRWGPQRGSR